VTSTGLTLISSSSQAALPCIQDICRPAGWLSLQR